MTNAIETRRMTVEGIRTSVLIGGNGEPGEAVVFVHGNPDAGSDWMPLMTRVAGFATVVAPDLPGFGGADERRDRDYTVYSYARFLDGVIRQLGLRRVHLVAHDFGGPFAAAWAADHPGNVASVTFLNTGVLLGYRWHRMARIWRTPILGELSMRTLDRRLAARELARVNPGLSARWADTIAGHLVPPKTRRAVLRLYRSTGPATPLSWPPGCVSMTTTPWWCSGMPTPTSPSSRPDGRLRSFPAPKSICCPGSGTGAGWRRPTMSPTWSSRSCGSGSAMVDTRPRIGLTPLGGPDERRPRTDCAGRVRRSGGRAQ